MIWTELTVNTHYRQEFVEVTAAISGELSKTGIKNGVCYLYMPHTTAGITINENADPDVLRDLGYILEGMVPRSGNYRHSEGNSDAHLKASLMGFSSCIPVIDGRLALGTWQGIYFCEFDGPRHRRLRVGFTGEKE